MTFGNHSSMVQDKDEDLAGNKNVLEKDSKVHSRASPNKNDTDQKPKVTPARKPINPLLAGTMNVGGIKLQTYGNSGKKQNPLLLMNNKKTPAKPDPKESPEKSKEELAANTKATLARGGGRAPVNRKR